MTALSVPRSPPRSGVFIAVVDESTTPSDMTIDYKVSSFQINLSSGFENKLLPNDLIIVRNHGDDEEDVEEEFGGVVDQQGQPSRVRVCFGVQEQPTLKSTPRPHMESVWDALYMDGKIISRSFQWHWFEAQIHSESTGIAETI